MLQKLSERTSEADDVSTRTDDFSVKTEDMIKEEEKGSETDEASEKGKIKLLQNQIRLRVRCLPKGHKKGMKTVYVDHSSLAPYGLLPRN